MATNSSTLAWKIPWVAEPGRLPDTAERIHVHFSLSCIGEGNGNPLQCSCLENPRDGAAWLASIYGIAQSRTRLKRLSSSSTYINTSFLFMDEQWYIVCTYHSLFIHWFELFLPLKVKVLVAQSFPTLCDHMDCSPPDSSIHNSPGENTGVGCHFLTPGDLPNPGTEPRSPTSQADSLVWVTKIPWTVADQIPLSID